jgi:hypothetical protein
VTKELPPLNLPMSLPDSESDVWQVGDKMGRSFYSSSVPANVTSRSFLGGAAPPSFGNLSGAADSSSSASSAFPGLSSALSAATSGTSVGAASAAVFAGRRRAQSDAPPLSSSASSQSTIFGFMSGGSFAEDPTVGPDGRSLSRPGSLSSSLTLGNRFAGSIVEEAVDFLDSDDEDARSAAIRRSGRSGRGAPSSSSSSSSSSSTSAKNGAASSSSKTSTTAQGARASGRSRVDSMTDDLQFSLTLDPDEDF